MVLPDVDYFWYLNSSFWECTGALFFTEKNLHLVALKLMNWTEKTDTKFLSKRWLTNVKKKKESTSSFFSVFLKKIFWWWIKSFRNSNSLMIFCLIACAPKLRVICQEFFFSFCIVVLNDYCCHKCTHCYKSHFFVPKVRTKIQVTILVSKIQ